MIEFVQALSHRARLVRDDRRRPPAARRATPWAKPVRHGASAFLVTVTILALGQRYDTLGGALVG